MVGLVWSGSEGIKDFQNYGDLLRYARIRNEIAGMFGSEDENGAEANGIMNGYSHIIKSLTEC